jgi:AraC-like DNA-binding protein
VTDLYHQPPALRARRDGTDRYPDPQSPYAAVIPRREVIPKHPQHSVRCITHDFPSEICGWNAHPEYEIHLITKTHGSFIAGDHIGTFGPGHVSLMGPNLPHDWVSDLAPGEVAVDRDAVIQFTDSWIRECMQLLPELQDLDEVLSLSTRGLVFSGATAWRAAEEITSVVNTEGPERVGHLFKLLGLMARAPEGERETVASEWMGSPDDDGARSAGEAGLDYIFSNLTGDIRLTTAARLAYMSEPTFSKYFKRATGLTFSNMVKKLRVAHARRLLDSTDHPVTRVATLSGYHNMANFNRQFLAEVGTTPSAYRRLESSQKPPNEVLSLGLKAARAAEPEPEDAR